MKKLCLNLIQSKLTLHGCSFTIYVPSLVPNMWSFAASTATTAASSNNTHVPTLIVTLSSLQKLCCDMQNVATVCLYTRSSASQGFPTGISGFRSKMEILPYVSQHKFWYKLATLVRFLTSCQWGFPCWTTHRKLTNLVNNKFDGVEQAIPI